MTDLDNHFLLTTCDRESASLAWNAISLHKSENDSFAGNLCMIPLTSTSKVFVILEVFGTHFGD